MKACGIIHGTDYLLDHLGVLCEELDIPLFVTDHKLLLCAKKYYPNLTISYADLPAVSSQEIFSQFDLLLYTSKVWACESYAYVKELYKLPTRIAYCPHGNSDKGFSFIGTKSYPASDIELYYGNHMKELLEEMGALKGVSLPIRTGNYRLAYYKKNRAFLDSLVEAEIFSRLPSNPKTALYAPTWSSAEATSSFFTSCLDLINSLPSDCNLIVKPHPFLERNDISAYYKLQGACSAKENILFVDSFPPIYPLLARCSFYIGDFSSIGYDFLSFDQPLFFFDSTENQHASSRARYLHTCGMTLPKQTDPFAFIAKHEHENRLCLSTKRKEMYNYVFGEEVDTALLKKQLLQLQPDRA